MYFLPGKIIFQQLIRIEGWSSNAGIINIGVARTVITTIDLGEVEVDDRVFASQFTLMTKGAVQGDCEAEIMKNAGAATVQFTGAGVNVQSRQPNVDAFKLPRFAFSTVARVTVRGTLTIQLSGRSFGSNSTVAVSQGKLYAYVIPGR